MLTYQEYTDLGFNSVSEAEFPKYKTQASYYLEYITFNKALNPVEDWVEKKVKYAMCKVIDLLFDYDTELKLLKESDKKILESGLKSETIKSHSVSFRDVKGDSQGELLKGTEDIIYSTLRTILIPTGLLYRGL